MRRKIQKKTSALSFLSAGSLIFDGPPKQITSRSKGFDHSPQMAALKPNLTG